MKITGFTVSVGYADYLGQSSIVWRRNLDDLHVVSRLDDCETFSLALSSMFTCHFTDAFTRNGAIFNKSGALADVIASVTPSDWILLFDADIIPPSNWRELVEAANPQPGKLYGAPRYDESGKWLGDTSIAGYFMLFCASDPRAQRKPIFDDWHNASGYDTEFAERWGDDNHEWIDGLRLTHLGPVGENWCGRGNRQGMEAMKAERRRRRGWAHERLSHQLEGAKQ